MAGNKKQKKFQDSKIPKKGEGKTTESLPIFKEPNTNSEKIGTIQKGELLNWINKSICDDREWIRLGKNENFGYIIGYDKEGKCNMDIQSIKETKTEKNTNTSNFKPKINENVIVTKEEMDLGEKALDEILNEPIDFNKYNEIKPIKIEFNGDIPNESMDSTEYNNSNNESANNDYDNLNEDEKDEFLDNLYYDQDISKNDVIKNEQKKLINELYNPKQDKNIKTEEKINNDSLKYLGIENFPKNLNFTISNNNTNEIKRVLTLSTFKIGSITYSKYVWNKNNNGKINIEEARSIINNLKLDDLYDDKKIKEIYEKLDLFTASIDFAKYVIQICMDDKLTMEEKIKKIVEKIGEICKDISLRKTCEILFKKALKLFSKFIKLIRVHLLKRCGLIGLVLDCFYNFLVSLNNNEDSIEKLFDKIYDLVSEEKKNKE